MEAANTEQARCHRCGRILRAPKSVARNYGRGCAAIIRAAALAEAVAAFSAAQVEKAVEAIADGAVVLIRKGVARVVSSKGDASYLVADGNCNCAAGLRDRLCWHRATVRIMTARGI